jgi:acetyl/propionyl-CoA carboxylase alpha subunit
MRRAVSEYRVLGITTNLQLFRDVMADEGWRRGELDTGFLERFMAGYAPAGGVTRHIAELAAKAAVNPEGAAAAVTGSLWLESARRGLLR